MASGLFGKASPAANTPLLVATSPSDNTVVNILVANLSSTATTVQVWASSATVAGGILAKDTLVPLRTIQGYGEYEKNAVILSAGENIWVQDVNGTTAVQVRGIAGGN